MVKRYGRGFTFLELLVTITIFSLAFAVIYRVFSTGIYAFERGEEDEVCFQETSKTLNLISRELRCAFLSPANKEVTFVGINQNTNGTDSDEVTFCTVKNPSPQASWKDVGLYRVSYFLEKESSQPYFTLFRSETPTLGKIDLAGKTVQPLVENVLSFNLSYYFQNEWREEWKQPSVLPEKVRLTLSFVDTKGRKYDFTTDTCIPGAQKVSPE